MTLHVFLVVNVAHPVLPGSGFASCNNAETPAMMDALAPALCVLQAARNVALLGTTMLFAEPTALPWRVTSWYDAHLLGVDILLLDASILRNLRQNVLRAGLSCPSMLRSGSICCRR